MTGAPAIVHDERAQWLARRRELLGASDVAAVLGVDQRRGPLAVFLSKVDGKADPAETRWMKFGRGVEGAIADWYADETGRPVEDLGAYEIQQHPDAPFVGATLDRVTAGTADRPDPGGEQRRGPLEAKAVAGFKAREWAEDPPLQFIVQLQVQMACTGAAWGSLTALVGGVSLVWRDLPRDDAFLGTALPLLEEFWGRVQRRDPPEADGLPGTSEAIRRAWAKDDGETVALDEEALALADEWEEARAYAKTAKEVKKELENKLRARVGSATFGALNDGTFLTLKLTKRDAYQVDPTEYRVLRRQRPKLPRR